MYSFLTFDDPNRISLDKCEALRYIHCSNPDLSFLQSSSTPKPIRSLLHLSLQDSAKDHLQLLRSQLSLQQLLDPSLLSAPTRTCHSRSFLSSTDSVPSEYYSFEATDMDSWVLIYSYFVIYCSRYCSCTYYIHIPYRKIRKSDDDCPAHCATHWKQSLKTELL